MADILYTHSILGRRRSGGLVDAVAGGSVPVCGVT